MGTRLRTEDGQVGADLDLSELASLLGWTERGELGMSDVAIVEDTLVLPIAVAIDARSAGTVVKVVPFVDATEKPEVGEVRTKLGAVLANESISTVLLDLLWMSRLQDGLDTWDQKGPLIEGVRLLGLLLDRDPPPTKIYCYSSALRSSPIMNIVAREPVAERLGCHVLDLPARGPIQVGPTEVAFIDRVDLVEQGPAALVKGEAPRYTMPGPTPADFDRLNLGHNAQLSPAVFAVEGYRGGGGKEEPTYAGGEVLATYCRSEDRAAVPRIHTNTRRFVRDRACKDFLGVLWLEGRELIRQAAGYGQLG